jgi:hypothetical protein
MHRFLLLVPLVALALAGGAAGAQASASGVVVSQVYAGGGNSGASYANDFVELFNGGSSAVDLTGWSIQYASAASTSWSVTALGGSIAPGHYYLVQLASSGAVGSAIPAPDATGTTNIANTGGKVALVNDATALGCGGSAGSCSTLPSVDVDIQPVLSITLERPTISFGTAVAGDTPAPVSERVTVVSNNATGYALTAHRTAFTPADLPLAIAVGSGPLTPLPIAPAADLTLATASRPSAPGGDVVPTSVGFSSPIPTIAPGHYSATLTYTLIGR